MTASADSAPIDSRQTIVALDVEGVLVPEIWIAVAERTGIAKPLMCQLGWPAVFCHRLVVADDRITDYRLRQPNQKQRSVEAFHALEYRVIAAGDSYNDTTMLAEADAGFLFHAPANVIAEFPQYPALNTYPELLAAIRAEL